MADAGFAHDRASQQPGEWSSAEEDDPPVDLLVPAALHKGGGRRGARIPPHSKHAARSVPGLEAAAVSHGPMTIASLEPDVDPRQITVEVASPAALVVAKAYKLGERAATKPERLLDKDAHDLYRLLRAVPLNDIHNDFHVLLANAVSSAVTSRALAWLGELADTAQADVPMMAGRAEALVGDPVDVAQSTWGLIQDLLDALAR